MGCDMLAALSRTTRDGGTLFGHNCNRPSEEEVALVREPGRTFAPGENVQAGDRLLPQVRRTYTVLAGRRPGQWGYEHGLNEQGVSIGLTTIRTKREQGPPALTGPELVRLCLERAASARQAVDVLTDLVGRHGQGSAEAEVDPAFLITDGREAFVVEMFGPHWAVQHVGEVRAVSDVCHLRQDWDHVSPGLADLAIARGWWPADGSKLDFAGVAAPEGGDNAASLRRWGRATLLLEQENGQINLPVLRRILSDHAEGFIDLGGTSTLCQHAPARTVASLITQSGPGDALPVAWYSFGPPCANVYFPLFPVGELPNVFLAPQGRRGRATSYWRRGRRPTPGATANRTGRLAGALRSGDARVHHRGGRVATTRRERSVAAPVGVIYAACSGVLGKCLSGVRPGPGTASP